MKEIVSSIPLGYYALSGLLNFITCLFLTLFVFFRDPRSSLNRAFSIFCFTIAQWSLFYFLWLSTKNIQLADFYIRTCMIGVIFMPAAFTHFVIVFIRAKKNKSLLFINYLISLAIMTTIYSSLYAKPDGSFFTIPYWPLPGRLFPIHLVHFFINLFYSYFLIFRALKSSKSLFKQQIRYVFLGTVIGFIGGVTNYMGWYRFGIPPVFNISASLGVPIITYAIIKYRLMDIKVAITRTGIFLVVYTLVLGVPFSLAGWGRSWIQSIFGAGWYWVPISIAVILASAGPFIFRLLQRKAENLLLAQQRHYQKILLQAGEGMTRERDLGRLFKLIVYIVKKAVKIKFAAIFFHDRENRAYGLKAVRDHKAILPNIVFNEDSSLITYIRKKSSPFTSEEIPFSLKQCLERNLRTPFDLVVPSVIENEVLGFLVLGEKQDRSIYTPDDINIFGILSHQAALAIENCLFLQELG